MLGLQSSGMTFNSTPFSFDLEVTTPASLSIHSGLSWKASPAGEYTLTITSFVNNSVLKIMLDENGNSNKTQLKSLIPNYTYDFTLSKPYYTSSTIRQKIQIGENFIDFGDLKPDITSAILRPDIILQFINN